jgi:tRNA-dihydrouridine synthase
MVLQISSALPFTAPWLIAPMEGVTEPLFREMVLARNAPEALGGAFTEFVRVSVAPVPAWKLAEHLGDVRFPQPVGLQLMGSHLEHLAASARNAAEAGAPLVDLNFGCPAKGALRGCAGSALLDDPAQLERVVKTVREAIPGIPVTAKVRAGGEDASRVEEIARAAEQGGAEMLTVHCRTRSEKYCDEVDWSRIARAASAVRIPVCGNGGIGSHADLERMRRETGARYAMVGRAALGDPWIFSGAAVGASDAAAFLAEYHDRLTAVGLAPSVAIGCVKQLVRFWTAGDLFGAGAARAEGIRRFLLETDGEKLVAWLRGEAAGGNGDHGRRWSAEAIASAETKS